MEDAWDDEHGSATWTQQQDDTHPLHHTSTPKKRQLVSTACLCCQLKHRACGVERPCFQCVFFDIQCVEGEARKKTRKKRIPKTPKPAQPPTPSPPQDLPSNGITPPPSPPKDITYPNYISPQVTVNSNQAISYNDVEALLFNQTTSSFTNELLSTFNTDVSDDPILFASISTPIQTPPMFTNFFDEQLSSDSSPFSYVLQPSPPSSSDEAVQKLHEEVAALKQQLSEKDSAAIKFLQDEVAALKQVVNAKSIERPLVVASVATAVWRLPDGLLLDGTKSLYILLKLHRSKLKNFDDVTIKGQLEEMRVVRRRLVQERTATMNRVGFKTLACGNGTVVTFMSCCLLVHFPDHAVLQSTIWNTA